MKVQPRTNTVQTDDLADYRAVKEIVAKTHKEKPKAEDIEKLRRMLEEMPKLWRVAGDFSEHALQTVLNKNVQATPFVVECVSKGVENLKVDLGYADSPPLEKMLINQIALCWLRLNILERQHVIKTTESHSTEAGLYWDRRLSTAQRRFTRATEALARVRKLTSATRLQDARAEAANKARAVNNLKVLNALTA